MLVYSVRSIQQMRQSAPGQIRKSFLLCLVVEQGLRLIVRSGNRNRIIRGGCVAV